MAKKIFFGKEVSTACVMVGVFITQVWACLPPTPVELVLPGTLFSELKPGRSTNRFLATHTGIKIDGSTLSFNPDLRRWERNGEALPVSEKMFIVSPGTKYVTGVVTIEGRNLKIQPALREKSVADPGAPYLIVANETKTAFQKTTFRAHGYPKAGQLTMIFYRPARGLAEDGPTTADHPQVIELDDGLWQGDCNGIHKVNAASAL